MRKLLLAGVAAFAVSGSTLVYAQERPWFHEHFRLSMEDRAALADARIAAVHAGLKLTPDQEKLWPPVEAAVRDFAKLRIDRANARMNAMRNEDQQKPDDPVGRLRERADMMATTAAALKRIADAADPLYKSLDDGQKRRLAVLTHGPGWEGWRRQGFRRGMMGGMMERGRDHGFDHDHNHDQDNGPDEDQGEPERL